MSAHAPAPNAFWDRRKTRVALTAAGVAVAAYVAYQAYNKPSTSQEEQPSTSRTTSGGLVGRLRATVSNYAQAIAACSGACANVANDLQSFLASDSNEVPRSLRQLAKLVQSEEVQTTLRTCTQTVVQGATSALPSSNPDAKSALETILEAILSDRGQSLVALAVNVATKNATSTLCEFMQQQQQQQRNAPSGIDMAVQALSSENGEKLLSLLITRSIRTSISAYVDATTGYNMYDDMVQSITKQEHRDAVTDIMTRVTAAFCKEVATAYRKATVQPANQRAPAPAHDYSNSFSSVPSWEEGSRPGSIDGEANGSCIVMQASDLPGPSRVVPQQLHSKARSSGGAPPSGATKHNAPKPAAALWLKQVVDLAREKDVRALVVDVTSSATREATRGVVETLVTSCRLDAVGARIVSAEALPIYALLSILFVLMMFALSPPATLIV